MMRLTRRGVVLYRIELRNGVVARQQAARRVGGHFPAFLDQLLAPSLYLPVHLRVKRVVDVARSLDKMSN